MGLMDRTSAVWHRSNHETFPAPCVYRPVNCAPHTVIVAAAFSASGCSSGCLSSGCHSLSGSRGTAAECSRATGTAPT